MKSLDLKDKKILYELDLNGRASVSEIAKKVHLSKEIVTYRMQRFQDLGYITGYYAIIDLSRLGIMPIRVYLKLIDANSDKKKELIDWLVKQKKVAYVAEGEGDLEISFACWVKTIFEFEKIMFDLKSLFKEYILEENLVIFTSVYHFHRAYILDKKKDLELPKYISKNKEEKIDELDVKILRILSSNARKKILDIAREIDVPVRTIAFRIKRLEHKKIIQGYRMNFDFTKFGYEYYKIDLMLKNTNRIKELEYYSHQHPNIIYIDETVGGSDFEFDVEIKNKKELNILLDDMRKRFPEIRKVTLATINKYHKLIYFPEEY